MTKRTCSIGPCIRIVARAPDNQGRCDIDPTTVVMAMGLLLLIWRVTR